MNTPRLCVHGDPAKVGVPVASYKPSRADLTHKVVALPLNSMWLFGVYGTPVGVHDCCLDSYFSISALPPLVYISKLNLLFQGPNQKTKHHSEEKILPNHNYQTLPLPLPPHNTTLTNHSPTMPNGFPAFRFDPTTAPRYIIKTTKSSSDAASCSTDSSQQSKETTKLSKNQYPTEQGMWLLSPLTTE